MAKIPEFLPGSRLPFVACIETRFPGVDGREVVTAGTGTLIGPRLLLTAGHVVFDPIHGGMPLGFQVTMGASPRRSFPVSGNNWRSSGPWFTTDSHRNKIERSLSGSDFGVIILESTHPGVTPIAFQTTETDRLNALELFVAGYFNKSANLRNDAFIASSLGTVMHSFDFRITYQIATLGGMSGGPVWSRDSDTGTRTIRGIHTSIFNGVGNALRITEHVFKRIDKWRTEFDPASH